MSGKQKLPAEAYVTEAARWLGYAGGDLVTARSNRADESVPDRNAAYMAQQAAEKAIKAVILLENKPFDMIHDVDTLATQAPNDFTVPASPTDLSWLSDLATFSRYPDDEEITRKDVERAIELAGAIVTAAREHFLARGIPADLFPAS